jgi:hypothetical protein
MQRIEVPFLAPVSIGHPVTVAAFRPTNIITDDGVEWLVTDHTARTLFCGERLWGALNVDRQWGGEIDPEVFTDPIAVITRWAWEVASVAKGTAKGTVSACDRADASWKTVIFIDDAPASPYR